MRSLSLQMNPEYRADFGAPALLSLIIRNSGPMTRFESASSVENLTA
jgi:hypothetical protein